MSTAHPTASMGWCLCGQCEAPFLSVCGARVRCPACGHVFTVETVTLAKPGQFDESKPSGKQWLLRIEIQCARKWAERLSDAAIAATAGKKISDDLTADASDWFRAWQQVKALRFGQCVEFPIAASDQRQKDSAVPR